MTTILCIAGFGDDASMFDPLVAEGWGLPVRFEPVSLPGFGAPALAGQATTLDALADFVAGRAEAGGARCVLAHSVASIIATLAATRRGSPLDTVLSLEGNLTPEDAYFSGTAARYGSAADFRAAFLDRLGEMATGDPILQRYRARVARADPQALWELGCDAHRFSAETSPGALLLETPHAAYLYNPENLPAASLAWLAENPLPRYELPGASHWPSLDAPRLLAETIIEALEAMRSGPVEPV